MKPILLTLVLLLLIPLSRAQQFQFPDNADSVRFAAIGDMGTGKGPQYEVAQRMEEAHRRFPFTTVIMLGDNLYGGSKPLDYAWKFELPYKPLLDEGVKFYASLGNHDARSECYYKPFNMDGATYYTFRKGNVRFFALNSNYMDPKQLAWLEEQLQAAGTHDWKICFFHHPLYSSGKKHGSDTDLRALLEPVFVKYGVDVVFAGHEHVYERIAPQKGVYYFIEGASGQLREGNLEPSPLMAKGFDTDRTFLLIEVTGDSMYFQAVSRTGQSIDSGVIERPSRVQSR